MDYELCVSGLFNTGRTKRGFDSFVKDWLLNFVLDGSTPLIQSIRAGFKDGIELLLENNPQINLQFPDLYDTALNAAIAINNTDLALNLIRNMKNIFFLKMERSSV